MAILALPGAARAAAEFDAAVGQSGVGRCHMDACTMFAIQDAAPVAELKDGTLFAFASLEWETEFKPGGNEEYDKPPIKTSPKTSSVYLAFCSKRRPMVFSHSKEGWDVVRLVAVDAPSGAEQYVYALYWASCHHYVGKGRPIGQLATKLGYRFPPADAQDAPQDDIKRPADLLRELGRKR